MRYLIYNRNDNLSNELKSYLIKNINNADWYYDELSPELIICLGGDGTMLDAIHLFEGLNPYFIGLKTGTLGFLTDYSYQQVDQFINDLNGAYKVSEHSFLEAKIGGSKLLAVNEFRIESVHNSLRIKIEVNDRHLQDFVGNGICVSSQIGSSAYNRSLGGAIIDDKLDLIEVSEIAAVKNSQYRNLNSSMIFAGNSDIKLSVEGLKFIVGYDHLFLEFNNYTNIIISSSLQKIKFIHFNNIHYFDRLKTLY